MESSDLSLLLDFGINSPYFFAASSEGNGFYDNSAVNVAFSRISQNVRYA